MYMVRSILNCKPGKVGELVAKFKELGSVMEGMGYKPFRLYTDVSGEEFWTLVLEGEYESLEAHEEMTSKVLADERAKSVMAGYHDLVRRGRREVYKVEG